MTDTIKDVVMSRTLVGYVLKRGDDYYTLERWSGWTTRKSDALVFAVRESAEMYRLRNDNNSKSSHHTRIVARYRRTK